MYEEAAEMGNTPAEAVRGNPRPVTLLEPYIQVEIICNGETTSRV